jgi:hypothetical protein
MSHDVQQEINLSKCLCKCYMIFNKKSTYQMFMWMLHVNMIFNKKSTYQNVYVNVTWYLKQEIMFMWMLHDIWSKRVDYENVYVNVAWYSK